MPAFEVIDRTGNNRVLWDGHMQRGTVRPVIRLALVAVVTVCLLGAAPVASKSPRFSHWIDGTLASEPMTQVQMIGADTAVIRQSVQTNFEAPFLYLLFGRDRALLLDTGAGGLRIRPTVDRLIATWRRHHGGRPMQLVVAHSHGHGDHHAGDDEFRDRPNTTIVGLTAEQVAAFFAVSDWPRRIGRFDLGGRVLDVLPTPGHEPSHIMIYDAKTRLLFSGDMLYPGRLYVPTERFAEFTASAERLAAFARTHRIDALLGAHIEMTRSPRQDFPVRATSHPSEHDLPLPPSAIGELWRALVHADAPPVIDRHADFIVYPRAPRPAP